MADFVEQLESLRASDREIVMATLVAARGGSPRPPGSRLFVGSGARLLGSVSIGGCVDGRVVEQGSRLLRESGPPRLITVAVDDAEALELGLACGAEFDLLIERVTFDPPDDRLGPCLEASRRARAGETAWCVTELGGRWRRSLMSRADVEALGVPGAGIDASRPGAHLTDDGALFVERFAPPETVLVIGATDVGAAVARLARALGMRTVVVDPRERYATADRVPAADELLVGMPAALARPLLREGTSVVLVTHDYRHELPVLREALRSPVRYVGMLAGRRRADAVRALLRDDGFTEDEVARLHAPIGLDIGGREPEDIALSILAQIVAVREGKPIAQREVLAAVSAP